MRPDIDIPWDLHGMIKEYAKKKGKSTSEAYIELLRRGLERNSSQP